MNEINMIVDIYCVGKVGRTGSESYSVTSFENNRDVSSVCVASERERERERELTAGLSVLLCAREKALQ
jgi:hypothetical protein